jgi:hypothetical protein
MVVKLIVTVPRRIDSDRRREGFYVIYRPSSFRVRPLFTLMLAALNIHYLAV